MQDILLIDIKQKIHTFYIGIENTVECWLVNLSDFIEGFYHNNQYCNREYIVQSDNQKIYKLPQLRKQIYKYILSDYLEIPEQELRISCKLNGKPYIINDSFKNVNFNVSHSKKYMLVGIKMNKHIGLDIQVIHSYHYIKDAYKSILSPYELEEFSKIGFHEQIDYLFCVWVQKEAIAKALGLGLLLDFTTFRVNYFSMFGKFEYVCQEMVFGKYFKISLKKERMYFYAIAVKL